MDNPIYEFARTVAGYWLQFVTGALFIGGAVGAVIAVIERTRKQSVSWGTYAAVFAIGGFLTASYYAWLDQVHRADAQTGLVADRDSTIQQLRAVSPDSTLGVKETKLDLKRRDNSIAITFQLQNYSTTTPIENISNAIMVTFGSGKDSRMESETTAPSMRLNPQQHHTLEMSLTPKSRNTPDPYRALIGRRQPIVAVLIYFTIHNVQFSQREVQHYDYYLKTWAIDAEQQIKGSVPWPVGALNGVPIYWTAAWLPPLNANCPTPLSVKAAR